MVVVGPVGEAAEVVGVASECQLEADGVVTQFSEFALRRGTQFVESFAVERVGGREGPGVVQRIRRVGDAFIAKVGQVALLRIEERGTRRVRGRAQDEG
jgi:hypothetical protein